ncbi:putative ADP/ATP carrier protein [Trypanosoma vivax]|nr:putative ADP/ATP carrier protein [Trypanosoma vivax]
MYDHIPLDDNVLLDVARGFFTMILQRVVMAPPHRVTLLATVEGELVKEKRLAPGGTGGILRCIKRIYMKEGAKSFFRGAMVDTLLSVSSSIAENIGSFVVISTLEALIPPRYVENMPMWVHLMLSLSSASAAVLLATPITSIQNTIVTNYIGDIVAPVAEGAVEKNVSKPPCEGEDAEDKEEAYMYQTATETVKSIYQRCGLGGFYRGVGLDAVAVFLYRGVYYFSMQLLPNTLQSRYPYGVARTLAFMASVLTQPFEVVSRRMQLTASSMTGRRYKSALHCARTIVAEEGRTALWSGLRARLTVTCIGIVFWEILGPLGSTA